MNDLEIAKKYLVKAERAKSDNIIFQLSFTSYKNLRSAKKCKYTGIELTEARGGGKKLRFTDRTIDRIDNRLGYVKGNCVTVCHGANKIKSMVENPQVPLTASGLSNIAKVSNIK